MKLKYVIVAKEGIPAPLVFPDYLPHRDAAGTQPVISAGFCQILPLEAGVKVQVEGRSTSLEVASRPEDAELIERMLVR